MTPGTKLRRTFGRLYLCFGPQHWWPGETPFEIAVGAILTQNTNWGNVEKAIDNLKKFGSLSVRKMNRLPMPRLASLIRPAGYFNIKAKRLKNFTSFLAAEYRGSMNIMRKEETVVLRKKLLSVSGIGPETADSILLYALEKPVFVIDAYTKRILSRHNILDHGAPYDRFQDLFHSSLDRNVRIFNEYHALLVRLGKEFCRPRPLCSECPLREA
jgi:endonuclease-3 related protein